MIKRVPQRKRIYFGCEGDSERSYGRLLNALCDAAGLSLFLDCDVLQPGAGDPLALIETAVRHVREKSTKHGAFRACAVLLDRDKFGQSPDRDMRMFQLASEHHIQLIWQFPCHEGLLLQHLEGPVGVRPANPQLALRALKRSWPEYEKGMPATELASRIDAGAVRRAADVDEGLRNFLRRIGFVNLRD